jgi:hypothetical protein
MAVIKSSDLDFDNIKASLKSYLQAKSEFSDYDFEASGLNNILDVLAYNTHLNGLIANIATNEAFLNSAQLRASAVSHAETLGYYPHSKTAASATITVTAATSDTTTATATLPKHTTFTGTIGDDTFTFQTLEDATATNDGSGNFSFKTSDGLANLTIKEGTLKTKTFIVGESNEEQVYIIPDENLDKTTLSVDVFDTTTSTTFTHYSNIEDTVRITADSTIYIVRETPNGFFELIFGEGNVLGKSPTSGNKIQVQYLSNNGEDANSISSFAIDADVTIGGTSYTPTVTKVTNSAGGDDKESIASIKRNTPLVFSSQQRLVTSEDYAAIIGQRFNQLISDIASWGGEDNVPPIYGRVYVSIKFYDGITAATQTATKNTIQNQISDNLAVMSIDTVFVDPVDTFLELDVKFDFDPELTNTTIETTQDNVKTTLSSYFATNLGKFDLTFRQSDVIKTVDAISPAILNSSMTVKAQSRFTPTVNTTANYTVSLPMTIAAPSQVDHIVTSSDFTFGGNTCIIRNKLNDTKLEIFDKVSQAVVQDNIGTYDAAKGTVDLTGFNPTAFVGTQMKISVVPANQQTIKPLRNFILNLDTDATFATGTPDFQNTETSLTV